MNPQSETKICPCDLCGSFAAYPIPESVFYTKAEALSVCSECGLVYSRERRPPEVVAKAWSAEVFGGVYSARIPAVLSRQTYVADTLDQQLNLKGKSLCDIGTGEGQFLKIARDSYGAEVFGTEDSLTNCELMKKHGLNYFHGSVEEFTASNKFQDKSFDIATIMWTLECCSSPNNMMKAARNLLKDGGYLALATGSRICVPFKKPLHLYLTTSLPDIQPMRLSINTISGFLVKYGFDLVYQNRYLDSDVLCVVGKKRTDSPRLEDFSAKDLANYKDDFIKVMDYFRRWHQESLHYR